MNKKEIETKLLLIKPLLNLNNDWVIGGSTALTLQNYLPEANDIDLIQHSGKRELFGPNYEKRMWSYYYPILTLDVHYSNPNDLSDYDKCFDKIINGINYIDKEHRYNHKGFNIVTPYGAGLINWIHHFLTYGYNNNRTITPAENDKKQLIKILGKESFDRIQWNIEQETLNNHDFIKFSMNWKNGD